MSKPDKPGELRSVNVDAISLVSKAANGEKFKIFKSADIEPEKEPEKEIEHETEKETVQKDERGLFSILKEFFTGTPKEEKPEGKESGKPGEIEKSGRKISSNRMEKLKSIQVEIAKLIDELNEANSQIKGEKSKTEEGDTMTKEELQKAIAETLKPITEKIESMSIKELLKEELKPITERIEKIEKARGFSNRAQESVETEKSEAGLFDGIF